VECGNHYYRAMSAWTLLNALTGFGWDAPRGELTLSPPIRLSESRYPFFTPVGWGIYSENTGVAGSRVSITLVDGEMRLCSLKLPRWQGSGRVSITIDNQPMSAEALSDGRGIQVRCAAPFVLTAGREITIEG